MTEKKEYPNSGIFFVNDKKREGHKDSDYTGNMEITCAHCGQKNSGWLNIWSKVGAKGDFWSALFKHKGPSKSAQASSGGGGRTLSSGHQQDMGYSRSTPPREEPRAQAPRRDFGSDISDEIPF
jgi:hypothetical protein